MRKHRRRSDRPGRALLFSPGRPVVAGRDKQRRFWAAIAAGMASEDAALQAGMSQPVGSRLFRRAGGMPAAIFRPSAKPLSGRYLSFAEREEIALLRVQGCSMREVARRLGRAASTISRELRRNAATRSGGLEYRATTAQWHAERSARRSKQAKLALNAALRTYVEERSAGVVVAPNGAPVPGPAVRWKGRRHGRGSIGGGLTPGARSRLLAACRSTSRTMRQCASAMKPSIKRCSFKVVVRCAVS
jgi:transposase-like protein